MKSKVYAETTLISYLTALPSSDVVLAAHHREWWQRRDRFDLFVSQAVFREAARGDVEAAARRLAAVDEHTCRDMGLQPPIICTPEELMEK